MKRSMSSVSHSDLYSVTSSVVRTLLHYVTQRDTTQRWNKKKKKKTGTWCKIIWEHVDGRMTRNTVFPFSCFFFLKWPLWKAVSGARTHPASYHKDTEQSCNPRLWSRERKLGQMGRRVSVVRFRPPLHYNAWWAGRSCAKGGRETEREREREREGGRERKCFSGDSRKANRHRGWEWHGQPARTLIYQYSDAHIEEGGRRRGSRGAHVGGFNSIIEPSFCRGRRRRRRRRNRRRRRRSRKTERERERERARERKSAACNIHQTRTVTLCVWRNLIYICVCVCVCVCEREREREAVVVGERTFRNDIKLKGRKDFF